jgi:hypothetical protein
MTIRIVPYAAEHEEAVRAFNARLAEKSLDAELYSTRFPTSHIPTWLPRRPGCDLYQEPFVAVDDEGEVRGGYILKQQQFLIKGESVQLADYQLPISEGIIDRRFTDLALRLYAAAIRHQPYLFGFGGGGYHTPNLRFLLAAGWKTVLASFWFRVVRPNAFLRNITALRTSSLRRAGFDFLAHTGLGWAGIKAIYSAIGKHRCPADVSYEIVSDFGDWADDIWNDAKHDYCLIAFRDQQDLNLIYPPTDRRFTRLKVMRNGRIIGWSVLLNTQMSGHRHFGNMRVGTVVGSLARVADACDVIACSRDLLEQNGADLIVSNQCSSIWARALKDCGFLRGPSNLPFLASPKVAALLEPFFENAPLFHLNRGDGDGPIHL